MGAWSTSSSDTSPGSPAPTSCAASPGSSDRGRDGREAGGALPRLDHRAEGRGLLLPVRRALRGGCRRGEPESRPALRPDRPRSDRQSERRRPMSTSVHPRDRRDQARSPARSRRGGRRGGRGRHLGRPHVRRRCRELDEPGRRASCRRRPGHSRPAEHRLLPVRSVERAHAGPAADDPRLPGRSSHPAHVQRAEHRLLPLRGIHRAHVRPSFRRSATTRWERPPALSPAEKSIGSYLFGASTGSRRPQLQMIHDYQFGAR